MCKSNVERLSFSPELLVELNVFFQVSGVCALVVFGEALHDVLLVDGALLYLYFLLGRPGADLV